MKKVTLFLDCDGVINKIRQNDKINNQEWRINEDWFREKYNLDCVFPRLLGNLINAINVLEYCWCDKVDIVISSSWRIVFSIDDFNRLLSDFGAKRDDFVVGVTPNFGKRGDEIDNYIKNHNIDKFLIVDDEDFDIHQKEHIVKCDMKDGFTEEKTIELIDKVVDMFKK